MMCIEYVEEAGDSNYDFWSPSTVVFFLSFS